ncbi:hypothetical protein I5L01_00350 [Erythrobacter sp. YJ-T3-07]|uniref:hypothetical protein n=1 Tax=Erythrobacter sp. YJ-T3-07 TaxID=2793063 RepID=UPI0018D2D92F|nr:hypothetical protein [Erythrobacter sp. YJ-T3-07]MBH1942668.1 hypothetical protein [Erythrobacter sp. YJ-T3-07]
MADRLFVAALAERNGGKSTTWNRLFGREVRRGKYERALEVLPGKSVQVFLVSGSFEEREEYSGDILEDQSARIILCSVQYIEAGWDTFDYAFKNGFDVHTQWLNPGFQSGTRYFDRLGFADRLLHHGATLSIRDGKSNPSQRVEEIRSLILGWAASRNLLQN